METRVHRHFIVIFLRMFCFSVIALSPFAAIQFKRKQECSAKMHHRRYALWGIAWIPKKTEATRRNNEALGIRGVFISLNVVSVGWHRWQQYVQGQWTQGPPADLISDLHLSLALYVAFKRQLWEQLDLLHGIRHRLALWNGNARQRGLYFRGEESTTRMQPCMPSLQATSHGENEMTILFFCFIEVLAVATHNESARCVASVFLSPRCTVI